MSVRILLMSALSLVVVAGCQPAADTAVEDPPTAGTTEGSPSGATGSATNPGDGDAVELTPDNTSIEFVGSHIVESGPDPDARHGSFTKFTGTATVADGKLTAVSVDVDTASIQTTEDKLTGHLKSPDFFDVREHPSLTFESTGIESGDDGSVVITGDLTMLDQTKSISFPATVNTEGGVELSAEFTIDRTEFGMTFGEDKIEKEVTLAVKVQKS